MAWIGGYGFLGLSILIFAGGAFAAAFLTTFTVENRLDRPVFVTPLGASGPAGERHPLPVSHDLIIAVPSAARGGYEVPPGGAVAITYDWDDINLSEIVVEDRGGVVGCLIADPDPTVNQYRPPPADRYLIRSDVLVPVPAAVVSAARRGREYFWPATLLQVLLFAPWPVVVVLDRLSKRVPLRRAGR